MRRAAFLIVALVAACGPKPEDKPAASSSAAAAAPAGPTMEELEAARAALPAPYDEADIADGKRQFSQCRSCHLVSENMRISTGPNLYGLFGRVAGSVEGYPYSDALAAADFIWEPHHLNDWLADPRGYLPGSKMYFPGIADEASRRDVIAYLMIHTAPAAPAAPEPADAIPDEPAEE